MLVYQRVVTDIEYPRFASAKDGSSQRNKTHVANQDDNDNNNHKHMWIPRTSQLRPFIKLESVTFLHGFRKFHLHLKLA